MTGFPASPTVSAAMRDRRSIRAFTEQPVDPAVLRTIMETAQRAPSGGNVQPWMVSIVTGDALADLIAKVGERLAMGPAGSQMEYQIYPDPTPDPWMSRRYGVA
jgi:nitroreductase